MSTGNFEAKFPENCKQTLNCSICLIPLLTHCFKTIECKFVNHKLSTFLQNDDTNTLKCSKPRDVEEV